MKKNDTDHKVTNLKPGGIPSPQKWLDISHKLDTQYFKEHQCFEPWSSEKKRWQMYSSFPMRFRRTQKLFFRTIHSANQLSICGAA